MKIFQRPAVSFLTEPHMSLDCVATVQYAYLLEQVSEIINLANYVLGSLFEDDAEHWFQLREPKLGRIDVKVRDAVMTEARLQMDRQRIFNGIMLCQMYDAFDLYCARIRNATKTRGDASPGCGSKLDENREVFRRNGWPFLADNCDYQMAVLIKDSRNIITHNHGVVTKRFHRNHPSVSDGVNTVLHIYYEELEEHMIFLTRMCFILDDQIAKSLSLKRKPIRDWEGTAVFNQNDEE